MFLEEGAGDFAGFGEGGAGDEDEAELGGGWHGMCGKIVADLDLGGEERGKDNAETRRAQSMRREEEEEDWWRWIVRAHPLQKTQRMGRPQVPW